ncbi:D-galactoside/L-rhamnose binding SUEL lectin domain [Macleaya cordata]|uniref:Beta-galactosidase n=1 Tax=Macleaya cordata TaxID=56857 RepID=A0A200QCY8_MACCD|nr:D-galactoside/L-rhamnose binding SUEL lectin domain [Macleaya cordata]
MIRVYQAGLLSHATDVSYDSRALKINGERRIIFSGAIHYPRSTPGMWPDLIQKAKEGGLDAIETYVFWNAHEPRRREYDFTGNLDLVRFLRTVQDAGLYAILRIGPYACAEWNYGGFPVWLHNLPGVELRTDNQIYKDEMQNFTTLIVNMVKQEKLLAPQGGPIIITQIENEFGNVMTDYGDAGKSYVQWCAKMAVSLNVGVPWIMCMQADAPHTVINTHNGFYADYFKPNNPNSPKMWTENWSGWYKTWGKKDPSRPVEDLAYAVALFFESGGTLTNYYMYHGGTNFGRTSGVFITTSYDYDSPLDEYGNLRQPKWGHLKQLHSTIKSMEKILTEGDVSVTSLGNGINATIYTANGTSGCFLSNKDEKTSTTVTFKGNQYFLPAWSVSILPDCKKEAYNTAKVNVQTSLMVKKPNSAENEPAQLKWLWKPEPLKDTTIKGKGTFSAMQLLEQKAAAADASDYLWYMTSVNLEKNAAIWSKTMTLRVNTTGPVLHAYVNGKLIASQYGLHWKFMNVLEGTANMKPGINHIAVLSATVGLPNYGSFFDKAVFGIVGGPVELVGNRNVTMDLSTNKWFYKVGLNGEDNQFYSDKSPHAHSSKWNSDSFVIRRMMTWYKTTFKAPPGEDPVVVDLQGMGKGHAWVNGNSLGRYWPSVIAEEGCDPCDYRGKFQNDRKCMRDCGVPTQRWYHVPRSFLQEGTNTLVLFEEAGGDPAQVSFQTVTVGTICANTYEGNTLELSCQGNQSISAVQFASFGDPQGNCGSFKKGTCEAANSLSVVQKACVGKSRCSIDVSEGTFGSSSDHCGNNITKRLAVQAVC